MSHIYHSRLSIPTEEIRRNWTPNSNLAQVIGLDLEHDLYHCNGYKSHKGRCGNSLNKREASRDAEKMLSDAHMPLRPGDDLSEVLSDLACLLLCKRRRGPSGSPRVSERLASPSRNPSPDFPSTPQRPPDLQDVRTQSTPSTPPSAQSSRSLQSSRSVSSPVTPTTARLRSSSSSSSETSSHRDQTAELAERWQSLVRHYHAEMQARSPARPRMPVAITISSTLSTREDELSDSEPSTSPVESSASTPTPHIPTEPTTLTTVHRRVSERCIICYDMLIDPADPDLTWCEKQCGQTFHASCLRMWDHMVENNPLSCPTW